MPYPSLERYNEAFHAHASLLTDPELKRGSLAKTGLGMPLAISGGFALTYTITSGGNKFAVRCFHRDAPGLERRYAAIDRRLKQLRSPYFLEFQFQPTGITVGGAPYPIVKMAWAKGETLGEFLEDKRGDAIALGKLIDALDALGAFFEREGISHGDVQTGNLMVSGGGSQIQLIDYDGMYVDEIKDLRSEELGHLNFQHPGRKSKNPFGPGLDRFSLISLRVALKALRADPSIWAKTKSELDAIVFRANDFADPSASLAFARVAAAPGMAAEVAAFAAICKSPMDRTPSLADFVAGRNTPSMAIALSGAVAVGATRAGYIGAYAVLAANDYKACLAQVGFKVEVIGKIVDVAEKRGKGGRYLFVNFDFWKRDGFRLAIWKSGLDTFAQEPDRSWVGKWVSVTGLMDPPYTNPEHGCTHVSISIASPNQISLIDEAEARWRLAGPGSGAAPAAASTSNRAALDKILGQTGGASTAPSARPFARPMPPPVPPAPPRTPLTPNQRVLNSIRAASAPAVPTPTPNPRAPASPRPSAPHSARQTPIPPRTRPRSEFEVMAGKLFKWLFK